MNLNVIEVSDTVLFTREPITTIDGDTVAYLKMRALADPVKSLRLCMHADTEDPVQEMLIVHVHEGYVRPHRHDHGASYHIVDGQLDIVMFDDGGQITDVVTMGEYSSGSIFYWRISGNRYYTVVSRSDAVVFHESLNGPFSPGESTNFAPWAPEPSNVNGVKSYMVNLSDRISRLVEDLK